MEDKIIVAADFGNSKITVAVARKKEDGGLELIDFQSVESDKDLINDGKIVGVKNLANTVTTLVEKIEKANKIQIGKLHFAAAPHTLRSEIRRVSIDNSATDNIENLKENLLETAKEIEISDTRSAFDAEQLEITVRSGKADGNFLVMSSQDAVQEDFANLKTILSNKYESKFFVAPLVLAKQLLSSEQKKKGALMIDLGYGCTSFAVYQNGLPLVCAVIPLGGKHITGDIKKTFNIAQNTAEQLKINPKYGLAITQTIKIGENIITENEIKSVISARLNEIFGFIFDELENQNIEDIKEIVLTGGGSKMNYLTQYLTKLSSIETKIADFNITISNIEHQNFVSSDNALLFALLKNCDEDCRKIKSDGKNNQSIINIKPQQRQRRQRPDIRGLFNLDIFGETPIS